MLYSAIAQGFFVALAAVTALAFLSGDGWVILSASLHLFNYLLVSAFLDHRPHAFQSTNLFIDTTGACAATAIAIRSKLMWAGTLAAFQIIGVCTYFSRVLDPSLSRQVFQTSFYVWEIGAQASLGYAVVRGFAVRLRQRRARGQGRPMRQ